MTVLDMFLIEKKIFKALCIAKTVVQKKSRQKVANDVK